MCIHVVTSLRSAAVPSCISHIMLRFCLFVWCLFIRMSVPVSVSLCLSLSLRLSACKCLFDCLAPFHGDSSVCVLILICVVVLFCAFVSLWVSDCLCVCLFRSVCLPRCLAPSQSSVRCRCCQSLKFDQRLDYQTG